MKNRKIVLIFSALFAVGAMATNVAPAAVKSGKQSAIQSGKTVRTKLTAEGLYNQACYDAYYGCMDQFCIPDNTNGGSCACSDDSIKFEKDFADIQKTMEEATRISTIEVEKIKAGAQADIIFNGERKYGEDGNVLDVDEMSAADAKAAKRQSLMAMFNTQYDEDEDIFGGDISDIMEKQGGELFTAAESICMEQVPENCDKDIRFLRQLYGRQIQSDCKAFENSIKQKRAEADLALADAEAQVRDAMRESFENANKYDRGTCMVEYKKCMQTEDACGKNWENCVFTIASENMQNNKAESTAGTKVKTVDKYDIADSTMEILESKRYICERVLDQCMAVRDGVWNDFLRESAPTIKMAELAAESKARQSCLTDISKCIQTACKDDIVGKGVDTMDACLAHPDMVRSFCKVEIDACERMEPMIWGYVTDKLKAMRVDACTQEVKDCFTADTRCGANFQNCIGMDYDYIHEICPIDTLVVCKADNPNFSMDDLDSMLMGLYLNIDNAAMEQCQELVDNKMIEVCGSTTDCNKFAADDVIGTGSLRSQKDDTIYRVTGMISFGSIKMGDASGQTVDNGSGKKVVLKPGEIGVQEYIAKINEKNAAVPNKDGIISAIEEELNNIAGTINRTIELIEQDPEIQFCVNGRNLEQITGKKGDVTTARFPNLLNSVKMQIAVAALRKAQDNYNAKLTTEIAKATKDASADLAQYMCQKIAENGGAGGGNVEASTPLAPPYAITYDVGSGLTTADLTTGGTGVVKATDGYMGSGMTKTVTSIFTRETRNCHICTTITTMSCKKGRSSWFHSSSKSCTAETKDPVCEDIPM